MSFLPGLHFMTLEAKNYELNCEIWLIFFYIIRSLKRRCLLIDSLEMGSSFAESVFCLRLTRRSNSLIDNVGFLRKIPKRFYTTSFLLGVRPLIHLVICISCLLHWYNYFID